MIQPVFTLTHHTGLRCIVSNISDVDLFVSLIRADEIVEMGWHIEDHPGRRPIWMADDIPPGNIERRSSRINAIGEYYGK